MRQKRLTLLHTGVLTMLRCIASTRYRHSLLPIKRNAFGMQMFTTKTLYCCDVDAEPIERYRTGGYLPVHLGDIFNDRYKVMHKLGWGGYSTVWLARDLKLNTHVALKVNVAESHKRNAELETLQYLSGVSVHPGTQHISSLLDHFEHSGPNGTHTCLVLEILGLSVKECAEHFEDGRLPGHVAKRAARQALLGLQCMHAKGVAHGDLHPGNILFAVSDETPKSENDIYQVLGRPVTAEVARPNGDPINTNVPRYLVLPTTFPAPDLDSAFQVKLADLGEAFTEYDRPASLHCPLVFRAPETIFSDTWDYRVDIWSMGCTLFELVVGYPPFDNIFQNREGLVRQMIESIGELPQPWKDRWRQMSGPAAPNADSNRADDHYAPVSLEEWLKETYFENGKKQDLSRADIDALGLLLRQIMCFEAATRLSATEILSSAWFRMK